MKMGFDRSYPRKAAKEDAAPVQLTEVDFVYELFSLLLPQKVSSECFSGHDVQSFQLSPRYKLESQCNRFGKSFISDLFRICFDYRKKMLDLGNLVGNEGSAFHKQQNGLTEMMTRPFKTVLKKFIDNTSTEIQGRLTAAHDLTSFNEYIIKSKGELDKVHHFFKDLFHFHSPEKSLQLADKIWNKFLVGLNTSCELSEELPIWRSLYEELLKLLGVYFNEVCRQRKLCIEEEDMLCNAGPSFSNGLSHLPPPSSNFMPRYSLVRNPAFIRDRPEEISDSKSTHFDVLWTQQLRFDIEQAFRFAEKFDLTGHSLSAKSFVEIFKTQMKLNSDMYESRNPFIFAVFLLERSAELYKAQYLDYVYREAHENGKLESALNQIKQFYTLNAFAFLIPDIIGEAKNRGLGLSDWVLLLKTAITGVQQRCQRCSEAGTSDNDKWDVTVDDYEKPWQFKLRSDLQWPLGVVLDGELFGLLDLCLEKCLILFHAHTAVSEVMRRNKLGVLDLTFEVRRKRWLGHSLMHTVAVVYSVLRSHLEKLICRHCDALLECKSVMEMEKVVQRWKSDFYLLLNNDQLENGSYIHAAVEALCELIGKYEEAELEYQIEMRLMNRLENMTSSEHRGSCTPPRNSLSAAVSILSLPSPPRHHPSMTDMGSLDRTHDRSAASRASRKIERWIKSLDRIQTLLKAAINASTGSASGLNNVGYAIAVLLSGDLGQLQRSSAKNISFA
ncbi:hypothetical protein DdX_15599 [Ditylenchus destructor]|uniref:Uncharacterized protein n=1 Tax=Ditylenchus destructor TaxID=166010 RepID=A0AAD4MQ25_9BILA|nr:hypothetical protein DdX_15599 [Ditylenchus destructor]